MFVLGAGNTSGDGKAFGSEQNKAVGAERMRDFSTDECMVRRRGAKPLNVQEAEIQLGKLSWNNSPTFTPEKVDSTLTRYFNIIEENEEEGWKESRKIRAMVQAICRNNPDMIRSNPWIYNVKDKLEENWSNWDFS